MIQRGIKCILLYCTWRNRAVCLREILDFCAHATEFQQLAGFKNDSDVFYSTAVKNARRRFMCSVLMVCWYSLIRENSCFYPKRISMGILCKIIVRKNIMFNLNVIRQHNPRVFVYRQRGPHLNIRHKQFRIHKKKKTFTWIEPGRPDPISILFYKSAYYEINRYANNSICARYTWYVSDEI